MQVQYRRPRSSCNIFGPIRSRPVAIHGLSFWINLETCDGVINVILKNVSFGTLLFIRKIHKFRMLTWL